MNRHVMNRLFWGLLIVAIGAGFLFNQMGIFTFDSGEIIRTFWPGFLILFGFQSLFTSGPCRNGSNWWGWIPMIVGFIFLGRNLDWFDWSIGEIMHYAWPLVVIIIGINMIFGPRGSGRRGSSDEWREYPSTPQTPPVSRPIPPAPPLHPDPFHPDQAGQDHQQHYSSERASAETVRNAGESRREAARNIKQEYRDMRREMRHQHRHHHERVEWWNSDPNVQTRSGFIGDIHLGQDYWELKPMNISHFIGDTVLDLTKAQIPAGETKITISSFIGDVKVFIPNDYEVGIQVVSSAFLGDASVLEHKEGGLFKNMNVETPYFHETDKKIRLIVSTFIGDVRVTKVG